jgi:DNA-binding MarR family transcriptional regulator
MNVKRKPDVAAQAPASVDAEINLGILTEVVGFRIRRIQNHLSREFAARIHRKEVRPGLFTALALINANPGVSQITLAREVGFNEATVVSLLDTLETLKWAERRRSADDRRRSALFSTKSGEKALASLRERAIANEANIRAALTEAEMDHLFVLLDKIYAVCCAEQEM